MLRKAHYKLVVSVDADLAAQHAVILRVAMIDQQKTLRMRYGSRNARL